MYANKVDCIFIDPPYNTGNEGWCYNDNVNSPMMQALNRIKALDHAAHQRLGELELVVEDGTSMACNLVLMTEWKTRLPLFSVKAGK